MNKKYFEAMRLQDIGDAKRILRNAHNHRNNGAYHADLMRVVHLHINAIRYANKKLEAYVGR